MFIQKKNKLLIHFTGAILNDIELDPIRWIRSDLKMTSRNIIVSILCSVEYHTKSRKYGGIFEEHSP